LPEPGSGHKHPSHDGRDSGEAAGALDRRQAPHRAPLILTLADELEQEERVSARGVILADRLIRDGGSPVYGPDPIRHPPDEIVESAVKHARAALHLG
jgi:hypothetical protein